MLERVVVNGATSSFTKLHLGKRLPHGTVLGPLLFLLCINELSPLSMDRVFGADSAPIFSALNPRRASAAFEKKNASHYEHSS